MRGSDEPGCPSRGTTYTTFILHKLLGDVVSMMAMISQRKGYFFEISRHILASKNSNIIITSNKSGSRSGLCNRPLGDERSKSEGVLKGPELNLKCIEPDLQPKDL